MNISLQNVDKVSALLTLKLEKADYQSSVEKTLKTYRQKANIPGFRPGMVPMSLIKKQFGKSVLAEEVDKMMQEKVNEYIRDNKEHTTNVTLRNSQGDTKFTRSSDFSALGCAFTELTAEQMRQMRLSSGLKVAKLTNGKFKSAGIKEGFIILDINNSRVRTTDDVEKIYNAIMQSNGGDKVMFITGIYPTGRKVYYAVDLSEE